MGFQEGAQMALSVAGIRNRRKQQAWLRKLQEQRSHRADITFQEGREDRANKEMYGQTVSNALGQEGGIDRMALASKIAPYAPGQAINLATAPEPDSQENKLLRQMFLAKYKAGLKPPTTKKIWDSVDKRYRFLTNEQIKANPNRYGMSLKTMVNLKEAGAISIGKGKLTIKDANLKQYIKTPQFLSDVTRQVKKFVGKDNWDLMEPKNKALRIRTEMDKQIRNIFGEENVTFDLRNGVLGWYDSMGKLIGRAD